MGEDLEAEIEAGLKEFGISIDGDKPKAPRPQNTIALARSDVESRPKMTPEMTEAYVRARELASAWHILKNSGNSDTPKYEMTCQALLGELSELRQLRKSASGRYHRRGSGTLISERLREQGPTPHRRPDKPYTGGLP
jgi:hypothetical protein